MSVRGIYVTFRPDPKFDMCAGCGHERRYHSSSGRVCCNGGCLCFRFRMPELRVPASAATRALAGGER